MNTRPIRFAGLLLLLLALPAFANPPETKTEGIAQEGIQVPGPPFTEGIFPCTGCHDGKAVKLNTKRRVLAEMHTDIDLRHGPESRWCLDCHDAQNRDRLHLASGEKIEFTVSYQLCGQCHGDKLRDWKVGIHGKRTGSWNGQKQYLLCVNCHNPHSPHFAALKPLPPPTRPEQIQLRKGGAR
jgi:hypothetical protein